MKLRVWTSFTVFSSPLRCRGLFWDVFDRDQKHRKTNMTHSNIQDVHAQFRHPDDVFPMAKRAV